MSQSYARSSPSRPQQPLGVNFLYKTVIFLYVRCLQRIFMFNQSEKTAKKTFIPIQCTFPFD